MNSLEKNNQNFVDVSFLGSGFKEFCLFLAPEKNMSDTMIPIFSLNLEASLSSICFLFSISPPKEKTASKLDLVRVGSRRLGWRTGALKKPMAALRLLGWDGELGWVGGWWFSKGNG